MPNPFLATLLSFFIPGLGQLYKGQATKALLFFIGAVVSGFLAKFFVGIPFLLAIWIFSMIDAYKNSSESEYVESGNLSSKTKICFKCQTVNSIDATRCIECGAVLKKVEIVDYSPIVKEEKKTVMLKTRCRKCGHIYSDVFTGETLVEKYSICPNCKNRTLSSKIEFA